MSSLPRKSVLSFHISPPFFPPTFAPLSLYLQYIYFCTPLAARACPAVQRRVVGSLPQGSPLNTVVHSSKSSLGILAASPERPAGRPRVSDYSIDKWQNNGIEGDWVCLRVMHARARTKNSGSY